MHYAIPQWKCPSKLKTPNSADLSVGGFFLSLLWCVLQWKTHIRCEINRASIKCKMHLSLSDLVHIEDG